MLRKNCIWKLETLFLIIMQIRYRLETSCKQKADRESTENTQIAIVNWK